MQENEIKYYKTFCQCGKKVPIGENFSSVETSVQCRTCREIAEGKFVDGRPIAAYLSTEDLTKELKRRELEMTNAKLREIQARSLVNFTEIDSLLHLIPNHDYDTCSDEKDGHSYVAEGSSRVKCRRCYLVRARKLGFWSDEIKIEISFTKDKNVAEIIEKISTQKPDVK